MKFRDLDDFTRGYIECMLLADEDRLSEEMDEFDYDGERDDGDAPDFYDIADAAVEHICRECRLFQENNMGLLDGARYHNREYSDAAMAGHDFYLTRNGHGAGFWDGDLPDAIAHGLTAASKRAGESTPYVGDDGKIYVFFG